MGGRGSGAGGIACSAGRLCHQGRQDCMHSRQVVSSGQAGLHAQQAGCVIRAGGIACTAGRGSGAGRIACTAGRLCQVELHAQQAGAVGRQDCMHSRQVVSSEQAGQGASRSGYCHVLCIIVQSHQTHTCASGFTCSPDLHAAFPPPTIRTHPTP